MSRSQPITLHLACLCAAWCRTCDAYAPVLQAQAQALREQGLDVSTHWMDIEPGAPALQSPEFQGFAQRLLRAVHA